MPLLLPEQRDDVAKGERRFEQDNGILYTNGTGTGKTASGLGVAKRFYNDGKQDIAVVVPTDKIASDWVKFAGMLGMPLKQLDGLRDNGGAGPVITTYANFGQNETLAQRDWNLIIADESHYLSSNEDGDSTSALEQFRALTGHHAGFYRWVRGRFAEEWSAMDKAAQAHKDARDNQGFTAGDIAGLKSAEDKARAAWSEIEARERAAWNKRWVQQQNLPKSVFLSATPFAYVKNTDYAEGYLFHYIDPAELAREEGQSRGYNAGDGRQRFMMQHFGYRMRYNKLTAPEAGVNSQLMEQQFNDWLKSTGALSGRRLEVPFDYDRKFVTVDDAVGKKIDEALKYLRETEDGKYRKVYDAVMKEFDYQSRMYLLEAIKARAAIPQIRDHLKAGRKVVVFHDFNKGGAVDPFMSARANIRDADVKALAADVLGKPMFRLDLRGLQSPIDALTQAFPDALLFNGTISKAKRRRNADLFNADDSGRDLIVVQSDAGREGVSLHDTTGKHQRVELNLGLPTKPVAATQIEGRIYRTGQASDAIFRYLTTGTAWEAGAFASKIAERASTAENLALGTEARSLKQAFIDAYETAVTHSVSDQDGKGGKQYDTGRGVAITPFERAKTFYWAQQKNTSRRDQRQGADYYATAEPLGLKAVEWADIKPGEKVLEPSAGHGAIARFFPEQTDVTLIEPSYTLSQRAALSNGTANIINEDFEQHHVTNKYDAIVMNPPYGHGGKTAIEHLGKAARHLREGGRVVAILPRGGLADTRLDTFLSEEGNANLHTVADIELPSVAFERAGTSVATRVLVLEKHSGEQAPDIQPRKIDLTNAENINEFFDRIENLDLPARKPRPSQDEEVRASISGRVDQTQTPEFKRWFGRSKMIDGEGMPQRMYHITASDFSTFKPGGADERVSGPAIWLTPDKNRQPAGHNTRGLAEDEGQFRSGTNVMPVYARVENPLFIMDQYDFADALKKYGEKGFSTPRYLSAEAVEAMKADGHDGIYYADYRNADGFDLETGRNVEVIAFSPEQIKSAIGNRGTFDPENPDIRYSIADRIEQALDNGSHVEVNADGERFSVRPDGMHELLSSDPMELTTPEDIKGLPLAEARAKVYDDMLARRPASVEHPVVGAVVSNRAGITKSRSNSNDWAKVATVPLLREVGPTAHYLGSKQDGDTTYHYLGRRVRLDGEPLTMMITLRQQPDGKVTYYNHTMLNDVREASNDNYARPSLRYEAMSMSEPATAERIRSVLTQGPLGAQLQRLLDSGRMVIHDDMSTVPGTTTDGMQAKTDTDGVVHMVAPNVTPQNAQAVLLHEMFHAGARPMVGTRRWAQLMVRLEQLYKQFEKSNGRARQFFDAARNRVETAKRYIPMSDVLAIEEFGAYAIEEYESAPAAVRRWVDDVVGSIKDFLFRHFGVQLGQITPAQLRSMAVAAIRSENRAARAPTDGEERYSIRELPENAPSDTEVEGWFSRKLTDAMAGPRSGGRWSILATAPMDRMVEELVPQNQPAQEYLNLKRDMDAYRSKKHQQFDTTAQRWLKDIALDRKGAQEMADIMHEATLAQTDPAEPFKPSLTKAESQALNYQPGSPAAAEAEAKARADEVRRVAHSELADRFKKLSPELQSLYREVRDSYKQMSEELDDILMANLGQALDIAGRKAERQYEKDMQEIRDDGLTGDARKEAEAAALKKYNTAMSKQRWNKRARMTELRQQLEGNRLAGPYFPLARFGDYFVTVRDRETGEVLSFSRFENKADQQQFAKQAQRVGSVQTGLLKNDNDVRGSVDPRFVTDVEDILSGASVPDAVKDQVWQRFLESMPDMSMRKGFIHRKGRAGFSSDALRAFASRMFHGAHQLGRLKYGAQMQEQLELAQDNAVASSNPERDTAVVNELNRRNQYVMNPQGGALAQHITSAAFVYHLSLSPAAALVNLSQTVMIGMPVMGAKYGMGRTAVALNRALGNFIGGRGRAENYSGLTPDERKAMRVAYESGVVDSSQSHNLAGVGETGVEYSPIRNRVMGVLSWMFHQAERLNREVTFLASYRMARQDGLDPERAIDQASRMTYKVHFDYNNTNRPRVMHGDVAKVALVFRNYQVNMLWRLFRDTHQAFNGEPAARREALHHLAGITGMMALNAGVKGVWLYGLAMALATMFFGDDAEDEFKTGTVELLGPTAAGFLLNGVPGHALGISLSERVGMPDLWFRSPDRQLEGEDEFNYWQSQLLGAVPGIAQNMWRGWNQIVDGHTFRGVETMSPKFVKDALKAARFATDGAQTLRGDPLVDSFKPNEIAAQLMGFTPAVLAEQYERNSALKNAETRIMDERRRLMDRYAAAYKLKDEEEIQEIRKDIKGFNEKNREVAITADTITRSIRSRRKYSDRTEGGVTLNPRLDRRLRDNLGDAIYR